GIRDFHVTGVQTCALPIFEARLARAADGGGEAARERHAARGKLLVRDRIAALLDPGSPFLEIAPLAAEDMYDGAAPAAGMVCGRSEERRVGHGCRASGTGV